MENTTPQVTLKGYASLPADTFATQIDLELVSEVIMG